MSARISPSMLSRGFSSGGLDELTIFEAGVKLGSELVQEFQEIFGK